MMIFNLGEHGFAIEPVDGVALPATLTATHFPTVRAVVDAFRQHNIISHPLQHTRPRQDGPRCAARSSRSSALTSPLCAAPQCNVSIQRRACRRAVSNGGGK